MNEPSENHRRETDDGSRIKSVIERTENQPDTCTIYTTTASGAVDEREWISAREGSYVFVDLMR